MNGQLILCSGDPALDLQAFMSTRLLTNDPAGESAGETVSSPAMPMAIPFADLAGSLEAPAENRFVFFYDSPASSLLVALHDNCSAEALLGYLRKWEESNTRLLQLYLLNQERCLLINRRTAYCDPQAYRAIINERLGIQLEVESEPGGESSDLVGQGILGLLIKRHPKLGALFAEMESSADLPGDSEETAAEQVCVAYAAICRQMDDARASLAAQKTEIAKQLADNQLLSSQFAALQSENEQRSQVLLGERDALQRQLQDEQNKNRQALDASARQREESAAKISALEGEIKTRQARLDEAASRHAQLSAKADELVAENSQLLAQLHEVQEELEKLFLKQQAEQQSLEAAQAELSTARAAQARMLEEHKLQRAEDAKKLKAESEQLKQLKDENARLGKEKDAQAKQRQAEIAKAGSDLAAEKEKLKQALETAAKQKAADAETQKRLQAEIGQVKQALETAAKQKAADAETQKRLQAEIGQVKQALETAAKQKAADAETQKRLQAEIGDLKLKISAAGEERNKLAQAMEKQKQDLASAQKDLQQERGRLAGEQKKLKELAQENELMLVQLHQVQEELEYYYLNYQAQTEQLHRQQTFLGYYRRMQPDRMTIDLRGELVGENWYQAEEDGRWGGPGRASTLVIPGLSAGQYQVSLDIVDTMAPELLAGLQLSLNGRMFPCEVNLNVMPTQLIAWLQLEADLDDGATMKLEFPQSISPTTRGSADERQLTARIRALDIVRL